MPVSAARRKVSHSRRNWSAVPSRVTQIAFNGSVYGRTSKRPQEPRLAESHGHFAGALQVGFAAQGFQAPRRHGTSVVVVHRALLAAPHTLRGERARFATPDPQHAAARVVKGRTYWRGHVCDGAHTRQAIKLRISESDVQRLALL